MGNSFSNQDKHETEENRSELELAYQDQGYHEMEFICGNESELHERENFCQKNPSHKQFVSAKKFTVKHLPKRWCDSLVFEYLTIMVSLTVRLAVRYTSKDRPPNYPLYNRRGNCGLVAFGSGWVWRVDRKSKEKDNRTCPCKTCRMSPDDAKTQWGEFEVLTAQHVVFDTSEAKHTTCNLFFDCDEDGNDCPCLEGVEVRYSDIEWDYSHIRCVTHDVDIIDELEKKINRYSALRDTLKSTSMKSGRKNKKIAVVISHPHGRSKHVTIGEATGRREGGFDKWNYNAETCPGSSGAPVCIMMRDDVAGLSLANTTHSGCKNKGQNESIG